MVRPAEMGSGSRQGTAALAGLAMILALCASVASAEQPADQPRRFALPEERGLARPVVPCNCRRPGGKSAIGETACVMKEGRWTLSRCEMTLNNTSWRSLDKPCAPVS